MAVSTTAHPRGHRRVVDGGEKLPAVPSLFDRVWWPPLIAVGGAVFGARSLSDNSFLTHLATGRLILEGRLPRVDPYTFTSGGEPWIAQSWLASWLYASLEALGGAAAIRLMLAALGALLALGIWRLTAPLQAALPRLLVVLCAPAVGGAWWNERPQLLAFTLLVAAALVLTERRSAWWLVPIFAVWLNVHGSFPLGLLFVGLWCGTELLRTRRPTALLPAGGAVGGLVVGAALNPYGLALLTFPVELLSRGEQLSFMAEWQPLALDSAAAWLFCAEVVLLGYVMLRARDVPALVCSAVFVALALGAVRNTALAAIVIIPFATPALVANADRIAALPNSTWFGAPDPAARRRGPRLVGAVTAAVAVLSSVFVLATPDYALAAYPRAATDWLVARDAAANPRVRILGTDYTGNYFEWRFGEHAEAWIDDRAELHSVDLARDYVNLLLGNGAAADLLDRHPHDLVLWPVDAPLAGHLRRAEEYEIVYRDDVYLVACRVGGSFAC